MISLLPSRVISPLSSLKRTSEEEGDTCCGDCCGDCGCDCCVGVVLSVDGLLLLGLLLLLLLWSLLWSSLLLRSCSSPATRVL